MILQCYLLQLTLHFLSSYSRAFPSTAWPAQHLSWLPSVGRKVQKIMLDERLPAIMSRRDLACKRYMLAHHAKNHPKVNSLFFPLLEAPFKA